MKRMDSFCIKFEGDYSPAQGGNHSDIHTQISCTTMAIASAYMVVCYGE